jgi:Mg2+ and Co2+ transporter CorA
MTKGLFLVGTNDFYELVTKLVIGGGTGSDIVLKGELAPQQVQVILFDSEPFVKNLDVKFPVFINRKNLTEKFSVPISNFSLLEVGGVKFIYSEDGAPRTFQIKKVLEEYEMVDPSNFDAELLSNATRIQKNIDELTQKIKPVISEMEKIKNEINNVIKERDQKAHHYHLMIQEKKQKFDQLKANNSSVIDQLNKNREEIKKVLKDAMAAQPITKLELDK